MVKNSRGISPLRIALKRALAVQWYAFGYIVLVIGFEPTTRLACQLLPTAPEIQFKELKQIELHAYPILLSLHY